MRHDWTEIEKKLSNMKRGEESFFHIGPHPVLLKKGEKQEPTLMKNIYQPKVKAKAIMDPSLDKTAQAGEGI